MKWLFERLSEVSTWNSIIVALTSFGVAISPELGGYIGGAGASLFALVNFLYKEKKVK